MFKKLGIEIKDKIYTEAELEILDQELILYYIDDELEPEVLQTHKSLDGTGVSKEQWQELSNRISEIEQIYHFF